MHEGTTVGLLQHDMAEDTGSIPGQVTSENTMLFGTRHSERGSDADEQLSDGRRLAKGESHCWWCLEGPVRRYCWLPVRDCKHDRHALQTRLFAALAFAGHHIRRGSEVAIVCDDGGCTGPCTLPSM